MSKKAKVRIGPLNTVGGVVTELGRVYRKARRGDMEMSEAIYPLGGWVTRPETLRIKG